MQHCRNDVRPDLNGLPPEQSGASAWRSPPLAASDQWIVNLSPGNVDELVRATNAVIARDFDPARLTALNFPLPTLAAELDSLRDELLHGRGFALLRGLPIGRFTRREVATLFIGLGAHLGRARSQNAKGHLLGHVCDLGLASSDPNVRIYQTHERQTFHTDSCDVVGLLCLREARSGGDSLLVSAAAIFNEMRARRPDLLARLLLPMAHDRRGEVPAGMKPWFELPVFIWHAGELTVFYQRQYIDSAQRFPDAPQLTGDDVEALDLFDALANDPQLHLTMRLAPGDIQFVHNHTLLHDRTAFVDWPEPNRRRHLLRLWLACPGARALPPAFAARYGSIEVGDRGGIVAPGTQLNVPLEPS
ncbi:MAG: TauD/TfdA family dioxygenase [Burkholderiaceae bacterium]